ncbi:hypothetical protein Gotur_028982 [Gossypium turneri]
MEKGFLDKVEDNTAVRTWSETMQREKGMSEQWVATRLSKRG